MQNKWNHFVTQTFLEHDQPSDAAVAIFKRKNPFELHMKIENLATLNFLLGLVRFHQLGQLFIDLSSWKDECFLTP